MKINLHHLLLDISEFIVKHLPILFIIHITQHAYI